MKKQLIVWISIWVCSAALPQLLMAQGSLTPSGAPSVTMKALDQLEPRIPISSLPVIITLPGSYYLTGNLSAGIGQTGITVLTNDVTINLSGFTLTGPGLSPAYGGEGIYQGTACRNLQITGGKMVNWVGNYGSAAISLRGSNCLIDDVQISGCGWGIAASQSVGVRITNCGVFNSLKNGIYGGVATIVEDCIISGSGAVVLGLGLHVSDRSAVFRCTVSDSSSFGIEAGDGVTIRDCIVRDSNSDNILVGSDCLVQRNLSADGGSGINVEGENCRIESNMVISNLYGISVDGTNNLVICNSAGDNVINNYKIVAGNKVGIVFSPADSNSISGDSGGGLGATVTGRPWVNFVTEYQVQ